MEYLLVACDKAKISTSEWRILSLFISLAWQGKKGKQLPGLGYWYGLATATGRLCCLTKAFPNFFPSESEHKTERRLRLFSRQLLKQLSSKAKAAAKAMLDLSPSCALLLQFFIYAIFAYSKRLVGDSLGRDDLGHNIANKIIDFR